MNKSVIYIVGATVLVGGGAYLFLKNKKKKDLSALADIEKLTEIGNLQPTTGGTPSGGQTSGGTATTLNAQQVLDKAKEDEAKGLATQIFGLKTQKTILGTQLSTMPISFGSISSGRSAINLKIAVLNKKISDLGLAIKNLGYKEVNGQAVKMVAVTTTTFV